MNQYSLRMASALSSLVLLASCCEYDKDTFYPHHFGMGMEQCLGEDLVSQGFSGAMNLGTTIEFVGTVRSDKSVFDVYLYDFVNYETDHGLQRILVMHHPCKYVGSYSTMTMPSGTSGPDILFDVPKESGNVIHFENGAPPTRAWFAGQIENLWK